MIRIENSLLRSTFARRIFLLFVFSAVIPVAITAILSLTHITSQLSQQGYAQSRLVCKAIGMEFYRRLTKAKEELASAGDILIKQEADAQSPLDVAHNEAPDIDALVLIRDNGAAVNLRGVLEQRITISDEQKRQLTKGKIVILTQHLRENHEDIILVQSVNINGAAGGYLAGKVKHDFIWDVNDLLPVSSDLLILSPSGMILYSSRPSLRSMLPTLMPHLAASISGHFEWSVDGEANLASFWSVFTQDLFTSPNMVIAVSQPKGIAMAPISSFKTTYIPLLLLAILIISFIAAKQIRKRLMPLASLQEATQRIANGNFSGHVNVSSDDEFAVLGNAFNIMADRLGSQFTSLSAMAEIDRLILSSFDARFIVSTVLAHAGSLTPCAVAAVLELDDDGSGEGKLSIRRNAPKASIDETDVQLSNNEIRQLYGNSNHLLFERGSLLPPYLAELPQAEAHIFTAFPTFIKEQLSTVVIFGYSGLPKGDEVDWDSLRKFVDHVSVALSNAGWEEKLYHQAHYDTLTNLPNRALLKDRLEQAIARAQRKAFNIGVLFLDLDHFKLVNDTMGHAAGDAFLKKISDMLMHSVRGVDTVVRFGGDEFVIIIPDIDRGGDVAFELGTIAEKMLYNAQSECVVDNQTLRTKMSIGIAIYPKDGQTPEELIKNADAAMYHAKKKGRGRYEFFAPELNTLALHRLKMEQELREALARDQFKLNFQPKVESISGDLVGAEVLIRWHHPERGLIMPQEFIGIAEESGLIQDIGKWVLTSACRQMAAWSKAGLTPVPLSVNVSPIQFGESNFIPTVAEILDGTQTDPGMLELEITETTVMIDSDESIRKLQKLRDMGIRLSIDDFGTGYSSLSYLRRLPIHILKIDQSFVSVLTHEDETQAIISATVILAHKLGLEVIAEGVETETQRRLLQDIHCEILQGYLIGRPMDADQFVQRFLSRAPDAFSENSPPQKRRRNSAH